MRLLVTRPEPEARELADALEAQGHEVLVEPLLVIVVDPAAIPDPAGHRALLVTSRNALKALEAKPVALAAARALPVLAVGAATAALARSMGFAKVIEGPGTAAELARLAIEQLAGGSGPVLELGGADRAVEMASLLAPHGIDVRSVVVYRAHTVDRLSSAAIEALSQGRLDGVVLMSARTAATYAALVERHGQRERTAGIVHFCLSQAVADALMLMGRIPCRIPPRPSLKELLALTAPADTQRRTQ